MIWLIYKFTSQGKGLLDWVFLLTEKKFYIMQFEKKIPKPVLSLTEDIALNNLQTLTSEEYL